MAFGDRLLDLLEEKDISQKDFAATLNIAPTTLNGYIKNKRQPDFEMVKMIACTLNVSTDYLLDFQGNGFNFSARELSLVLKLRTLNKSQKDMIYDLVCLTASRNKESENE